MMVPIPQHGAQKPEMSGVGTGIDGSIEKKKQADPLSFLANITEKVLGTTRGDSAASEFARKPSSGGRVSDKTSGRKSNESSSGNPYSLSKKAKKGKKMGKIRKAITDKKRKRDKEEDEEERLSSGRDRPPVAQVFIHNTDDNSWHQEAGTVASALQDEYTDHLMAAQAALSGQFQEQPPPMQVQLQQQLLLKERMMMMITSENSTLSHIPDNFLSRHYAALEREELELAALRRCREQLLLNNSQEEFLIRNAVAASNFNHPSLLGIGAGISNANNFDLAAIATAGGTMPAGVRSSASASSPVFGQHGFGDGSSMKSAVAVSAASMGYPSVNLMSGMSNSNLLHTLSAQNSLPFFRNPTTTAASTGFTPGATVAASDPAIAMSAAAGAVGAPTSLGNSTVATEEADAKRLAPARGVFNKSIKSKDDVIDSLARANARFYKNDTKKSGQQRFRGYQCEQWTQKYQDLLEFKAEHGNW
jgi:hypothetical protein